MVNRLQRRGVVGEEEEEEGLSGVEEKRNALHLWKLLRPNFSVKCMIYGRSYYLRSCPSTIQCHRTTLTDLPAQKITSYSVSENEKFTTECP